MMINRGARQLLKADPKLATRLIEEARLCQSKIFHWMYVGDTALHLAAAGYRLSLFDYCSPPAADPNAGKEIIVTAAHCTTPRTAT